MNAKPPDEPGALALAKAVKGSFFKGFAQTKIRECPLTFMIFLAMAGELFGPGADRHCYRAIKDAFMNLMDDDLPSLADECFGWAVLPVKIFTERHLRLLRGDVTTPVVVQFASKALYMRNRILPRYQLRLVRLRSVRHCHADVGEDVQRSILIIIACCAVVAFYAWRVAGLGSAQ